MGESQTRPKQCIFCRRSVLVDRRTVFLLTNFYLARFLWGICSVLVSFFLSLQSSQQQLYRVFCAYAYGPWFISLQPTNSQHMTMIRVSSLAQGANTHTAAAHQVLRRGVTRDRHAAVVW